jgi:hypothetical protein
LAYYIYRYRYLELIIKESLVVATFAAVVLAVYVYGIRRTADWAQSSYGVRAGVIEAILILRAHAVGGSYAWLHGKMVSLAL